MLQLKESNAPFWLIGAGKNGTFAGSSTNTPCYYKSKAKQIQLAKQIFKSNEAVEMVYLITGVQWDHMPSGSTKEELGYLQNKGKVILYKDEITECDYPKGVSRESLPKKGAKVYTSTASALENKGGDKMKLELKVDESTEKDSKNISKELHDKFIKIIADGSPAAFKKLSKDELSQLATFVKQSKDEEICRFKNLILYAISMAHGDDFTVESMNEHPDKYIKKTKPVTEAVPVKAIVAAVMYTVDNWETLKDIIETIKSTSEEIYNKAISIYEYLKNKNTDVKDAAQEIGELFTDEAVVESLKESKIVSPIGNPQTAGSFVNIDVDLDHMEVSDFIVRLAQSIRSEQNSVLEYVALRSANGITNEDRAVIDGIIEEEKNHMVAMTTLLYKQLLMNHQQNVEGANNEFVLPKLNGIFDENNKLEESINSLINKVLKEEIINSVDELIKELRTDTNYDELAYHIHAYSKTDKNIASKLMNLLFEIENSKSPKECRDELIASLQTNEDINFNFANSNMSQDIYTVEVDVNYDADFQVKVADNLKRAIETSNNNTIKNKYGICPDHGFKLGEKLQFELITITGFEGEITEQLIKDLCEGWFKLASTYEYFIELA